MIFTVAFSFPLPHAMSIAIFRPFSLGTSEEACSPVTVGNACMSSCCWWYWVGFVRDCPEGTTCPHSYAHTAPYPYEMMISSACFLWKAPADQRTGPVYSDSFTEHLPNLLNQSSRFIQLSGLVPGELHLLHRRALLSVRKWGSSYHFGSA